MSAARMLAVYRAIFLTLIVAASLQALLGGHEGAHNIVLLAAAEIAGAVALLWRRTQLPGACLLLAAFALAQVLSALEAAGPRSFCSTRRAPSSSSPWDAPSPAHGTSRAEVSALRSARSGVGGRLALTRRPTPRSTASSASSSTPMIAAIAGWL